MVHVIFVLSEKDSPKLYHDHYLLEDGEAFGIQKQH